MPVKQSVLVGSKDNRQPDGALLPANLVDKRSNKLQVQGKTVSKEQGRVIDGSTFILFQLPLVHTVCNIHIPHLHKEN